MPPDITFSKIAEEEMSTKLLESPVLAAIIVIICFMMSSLMSGLNIGLMSLDRNELQLIQNAGTEKEKLYAKKIIPVRRNGNFLLCSILITSTLCNSLATVIIDNWTDDLVAVTVPTTVIVLLCEILPQAICTYFPLVIGYHTIYITKACMILTAPVSYPLSKILDFVLGKEISAMFTKEKLKELLKMTQLPTNEEKIISGTLELSQKKVEEVMTMLDDVFKLPITAVLDFETINVILQSGYSRIPIYVDDKSNIQFVLLTKDLALLDPDDKVPIKVLLQRSKHLYIPTGTTLDNVLMLFKDGRGHMAFVTEDETSDNKGKPKNVVGIVTFEDVIEEIFQEEIIDETDTFTDNRSKRKLTGYSTNNDLYSLLSKFSKPSSALSDNLKLAIFHFLSGIDIFSSKNISPRVLLSILSLDVYYSAPGKKIPEDIICVQGVATDFFVMVIEGLVEVRIGNEDLKFEAGAFRYFGVDTLKTSSAEKCVPDYSLQAIKKTLYLKISKTLYNAAVLATQYEKQHKLPDFSRKSELYKYFKLLMEQDDDKSGTSKNNSN